MGVIFAHGIGGRQDLPIPLWLFNYQAVAAILGSVVLLALFWKTAKLKENKFSAEIKSSLVLYGWKVLEIILRIASLALFCFVSFAALFGSLGAGVTIAPVAIYVILWVGVILVSSLLGDSWQVLSPWDTIALVAASIKKWIGKFTKISTKRSTATPLKILEPPSEISSWLAVLGIFVFVWLELVHPDPADTRLVGFLILLYTIFLLTGASLWGRAWLKKADAFALLNQLIGSLGIFSKRRIHVPLTRTANLKLSLPKVVFIIVLLGSTTFDGLTNTDLWTETGGWNAVFPNSVGLVASIGLVGSAYFIAMYVAGMLTKSNPNILAVNFAHSLIPIALAYSIAHYFSLLIFEGQDFIALISDPLGRGWNLFGTADFTINYQLISTSTIAWIQALSIIIGHLWGVFLAHDKALTIWPDNRKLANRSQYPLVVVMISYTLLGLWLLLSA